MSHRRKTLQPANPIIAPPVLQLPLEQFAIFRNLLAEYSGVYLDASRQRQLEQSIAHRLAITGAALSSYQQLLNSPKGRPELGRLAELVLNHETMFFRNAPHFQALQKELLPELHARKPIGSPIRIWSAGCATGEEAYSLAIIALETFGRTLLRPIEILATDLSEAALQKAMAGVYRGRTLQNIAPHLVARYFIPTTDGYMIKPEVRALVQFQQLNLLDPFPAYTQNIDIIFCQNVTIYFQLETCRALIARFYACLPTDGLLFLGFSETLWNIFEHFVTRETTGAYVYSKPANSERIAKPKLPPSQLKPTSNRRALSQPSAAPAPLRAAHARRTSTPESAAAIGQANVDEMANRQLLAQGHELLCQGKLDQALHILRHIPLRSAIAAEALTLIARAHADRGDLDLASAEVQRAIELNALYDEAYLLRGIIASRQEQWAIAIQQLERARYLNADAALISFHLAEAYHRGGQPQKAMLEYRNTLQKLDRHPPGELLDGVAIPWLRETCQRNLEHLSRSRTSKAGA